MKPAGVVFVNFSNCLAAALILLLAGNVDQLTDAVSLIVLYAALSSNF